MIDIKKIVLILVLTILATPLHYAYDYNALNIKRENSWTVIDYKGLQIQTTAELDKNIKVEKVKEYIAKIDSECEVLKIVED